MKQAVIEALKPPPPTSGEVGTVDIPGSVLVRCPLVEFKLRPIAKHCPTCPHFKGLADRFPGSSQHSFVQRYLLRCQGAVTNREVFEIERTD
jgi:hypothetical protein